MHAQVHRWSLRTGLRRLGGRLASDPHVFEVLHLPAVRIEQHLDPQEGTSRIHRVSQLPSPRVVLLQLARIVAVVEERLGAVDLWSCGRKINRASDDDELSAK